jgi:uncharacterized BrkB/YihY/UPF0761 family membrane protein
MIDISTVPLVVFWLVFAGSVLFLDAVILFIGARYWRVCIAMTALMSLFALFKRSPSTKNQRDALVVVVIAVLTFALGLLTRIRSLRAAYRADPHRELGKLMSPREQMRLVYAMLGIFGILFTAALLLLKGVIP